VGRIFNRLFANTKWHCFVLAGLVAGISAGSCCVVAQDSNPPVQTTDQAEQTAEGKQDEAKLTIGSKAPELDIEHWISNGQDKFPKVKQFQSGKIYVIEFWATWCPPCIAAIPHISKLQEKYADKGVQVISVTDEDLDTVNKFLERKIPGKDEITFAEVTKNYCLTADPDSSVYDSYMLRAGEDGIPTAFIVGRTGLIEWIGHPMELDGVLEQVVEDKWDRVAFAEERKSGRNLLEEKFNKFIELFEQASQLAESGDTEEALAVLDEAIEAEKEAQWKEILSNARLQFVIAYVGGKEAVKAFEKLVQQSADDAEEIGGLILLICEIHTEKPQDEELLKLVRKTAEEGIKENEDVIELQYGLGRILFISGELDKSLVALEKTMKLIESYEAEYEEEEAYYEELETEVADWIAKVKEEKNKK